MLEHLAQIFNKQTLVWFLLYAWRPFVEISLIAVIVYYIMLVIRGTRALPLFKGLGIILILFFIAQKLHFLAINWILTKIFTFSVIAFLIIFQPELRRALSKIGQNSLWRELMQEDILVTEIIKAVAMLAKKRIGALIVVEQMESLAQYSDSGVYMDAQLSADLLMTLFMPTTPLHDGAVIIQGERVRAAGCLLPLSDSPVRQRMGTRHRAAIGISEQSDAISIVVSEETGTISVVKEGKVTRGLDGESLRKVLTEMILRKEAA